MIQRKKPEEKKVEYTDLNDGEKLREGDEYNSNDIWRAIPSCLIGDEIPQSSTKWRRPVKPEVVKVKWYERFVKFFS